MPSKTAKQARTMAAAAHNPEFAKKVGIPVSVAKEFNQADKGKKFGVGNNTRNKLNNPDVGQGKNEYFKKGGFMKHSDIKEDKPMMKKVAKEEVKAHEKKMHGMKKGGMCKGYSKGGLAAGHKSADGCAVKGKTKGKMV